MKIRIISDLHLDPIYFEPLDIPIVPNEKDIVMVIAGDAAEQRNSCGFIFEMLQRFKAVVFVCGNHEYFKGNLKRTPEKISERIAEKNGGKLPNNFHLLAMDEVVIDDVVFIGSTLWTDYDNLNQMTMPIIIYKFLNICGTDEFVQSRVHGIGIDGLPFICETIFQSVYSDP